MVYFLIVGKNINWGIGEGGGNFGEENQDLKNGGVEKYQVVENFIQYTPLVLRE